MSPILETISYVFGLVALGYVSAWTGLLRHEAGESLSDFAISVAVPVLLFRAMAEAHFDGSLPVLVWLCYFSAIAVTWPIAQFMIVHLFGRDSRAGVVGGLTSSFSNLVLLGIPFILGAFGEAGFAILSLIISIHLPIMLGVSSLLLAWFGVDAAPRNPHVFARELAVSMLTNPLIVGIATGLLWRFGGLEMPSLMSRMVDALADIAAPLALFALGFGLKRYGISGNVRPAAAVAALKLFLMPAIALAMALVTGLPPLGAKVVVVAASLCSGVNPYLIAEKFGTGQALASNATVIGSMFAVVTSAFWLMALTWIYG